MDNELDTLVEHKTPCILKLIIKFGFYNIELRKPIKQHQITKSLNYLLVVAWKWI